MTRRVLRAGPVGGILLVAVLPWIIQAAGWRPAYLFQVASLAAVWLIAALSETVIAGFGGQLSVGQAGFMAIGAYTTGLLTAQHGWPWWLGILAGVALSGVVALVLGFPTLRLRGPYFVMASLAFGGIVYTVAMNWIDFTGGPAGVRNVPAPSLGPIDLGDEIYLYYLLWIAALAVTAAVAWFSETRLGRSLMAIREDELAAAAVGIHTALIKSLGFVFSGCIAGFAGALLAHFIGYVSPDSFNVNQSLLILTQVLIGGIDRIAGAVVGTVVLLFVTEALRDFSDLQLLMYGVVMLIVILFLPRGIVGEATSWWERRVATGRTSRSLPPVGSSSGSAA